MEVRPGYKQTDVGVVPEDWGTDTLLRVSRQIMDYRGRTPKKLGMEWGGGEIPALSAGNVKKGFVDFSKECYLGSEELYSRWMTRGDVAKDDIIFTTEAPLGNVALVPDDRRYILSQRTVLLQVDPDRASSRFLFQVMLSGGFQRMLADYSSGSTAKGIQRKTFEQLCVALPPLPEQRAIATALSDVDALLGGLDRLIAKKRDVKQAAMQQLLTGKTRLPAFQGEWEPLNMAETSTLKARIGWQGLTTAEYLTTGKYYLVTGTDFAHGRVQWSTCCFVSAERYAQDRHIQLIPRDILLTKDGTIGKVGFVDSLPGPATLNSGVFVIRPKAGTYDPQFFYYVLTSHIFDDFLRRLKAGSTISHLYQKDFVSFSFLAPAKVPEQTAIAAVLSDMDAELAALEARREKTRNLKQAMMQELLTGKTRLVPATAAHA